MILNEPPGLLGESCLQTSVCIGLGQSKLPGPDLLASVLFNNNL